MKCSAIYDISSMYQPQIPSADAEAYRAQPAGQLCPAGIRNLTTINQFVFFILICQQYRNSI